VQDAEQKIKKFNTTKELGEFIDLFVKQYPNYASDQGDNWIDYSITDVSGSIHFFTDGIEVE
jgi:hypothetical protein